MRKSALALLLAIGCATARTQHSATAELEPPRAYGGAAHDADVDALVEQIYAGALPLDEAEARVRAAIARVPSSAAAHEVAGYLAVLRGNRERAWREFLLASATLDGPTELYLPGTSGQATRDEEDLAVKVLLEIAARHPREEARAFAQITAAHLLRRQGDSERAQKLVAPLAFVRDWLLVGPFDNDQGKGFLTAYPPEQTIDPDAPLAGRVVPVRWMKPERVSELGAVELDDFIYPTEQSVAYLATWIKSDRARRIELRFTTNAPLRVWANDELVASEEQLGDGALDSVRVSLDVAAGWTRVLVKSANRGARQWWMMMRSTDEHGAPLALATSAAPQPTSVATPNARVSYLPSGADELQPPSRKRFILARLLGRAGRPRESLQAMQELLAEHPSSLLAAYYGAFDYWSNEELGKTIDLLNQAVKASGARAAGILVGRSRYYADKRLYDRAQHDLEAALALDAPFEATLDLADVYRQRGWSVEQCRLLEETARKWPRSPRLLLELASCRWQRGLDEQGDDALARALALEPGDATLLTRSIGVALKRGQLDRAAKLLERERALYPTDPDLLVDVGELLHRRGDARAAETLYRAAAARRPGWPRPHELLGNLAFDAGRDADALAEWRLALERDPGLSGLAQRIERIAPTRLGAVQKYVPTDDDIDRALALKITPAPGAQAVLRLDHEVIEINSNGGARRVVTLVVEALNEHGRDDMLLTRVPAYGQVKILQAYALSKRGERQEASSIRGSEIRFRNLEVGSKSVVQYVHYAPSEHFLPNHYAQGWKFQSTSVQHEDSRWIVLVKNGTTLNVELQGDVAHDTRADGDFVVHTFSAAHVPPLTQELMMPPPGDVLRAASISTVPSWDDYVRWERALLDDALRPDRKLDELAARLTKDAKGPREKLDQLYHYATQDIRYQQDYETTIAGVRPHAPTAVIERGYGDCKDKALLLIQLAKRAGVQARFAILRTTGMGHIQRDVPNQQFNHAIVYVPAQPGFDAPFFLDPTSTDLDMGALRADDQGAVSLVLDVDSGKWEFVDIPFRAPAENQETHHFTVEIKSPTEATSTDQLTLTGSAGMFLRRVLHNPLVARKMLSQVIGQWISGATVSDLHASNDDDIWRPVSVKLDLDVSNALQSQGDRWRFTPPGMFPLEKTASLQKRETPIWFGVPGQSQYVVDVTLPEGYEVVRLPSELDEKHACFTLTRRARSKGRDAQVTLDFVRTCSTVAVADYAAYRDAVLHASRQFQDEIVFSKIATPPPAPSKPARKPRK